MAALDNNQQGERGTNHIAVLPTKAVVMYETDGRGKETHIEN